MHSLIRSKMGRIVRCSEFPLLLVTKFLYGRACCAFSGGHANHVPSWGFSCIHRNERCQHGGSVPGWGGGGGVQRAWRGGGGCSAGYRTDGNSVEHAVNQFG